MRREEVNAVPKSDELGPLGLVCVSQIAASNLIFLCTSKYVTYLVRTKKYNFEYNIFVFTMW